MTDRLLKPAKPDWVAARVATVLAHYFIPDLPSQIQTAVASDWVEALEDLPAWAIKVACSNWLCGSNCHRKPLPGQIRAAAIEEIRFVRMAAMRVTTFRQLNASDEENERTAEERERMSKKLGDLAASLRSVPSD